MRVTHDLRTRFEKAQHSRGARLNRSVSKNQAAGEIVTSPSITIPDQRELYVQGRFFRTFDISRIRISSNMQF